MALRIVTASAGVPRDNHWEIPSGSTTPVRTLLIEHGRIERAYSNDFSNAVYTKESSTVTGSIAGITAPDGTETAWIVRETTANDEHGLIRESTQGSNAFWGFGVFVKMFNTRSHVRLYVFGDSGTPGFVHFNLNDTGSFSISNGSGNIVSARMQDYGDGWWRLSTFWRIASFGTQQAYLRICQDENTVTYVGDTAEGMYVWGWNYQDGASGTLGSPNTPVASYISSSTTDVTKQPDFISFPSQSGAPQDSSVYIRGMMISTTGGGAVIQLGSNGASDANAGIRRNGTTGFAEAFLDTVGTGTLVTSTESTDATLLNPGNQIELLMHISSSRQVQLFHTKAGGSVVTSSISAVSTGAFPTAWGGNSPPFNDIRLCLPKGTSQEIMSFAYQNVLIVRGLRSMEEMRTFAGIT
jgi:hypothetical protein